MNFNEGCRDCPEADLPPRPHFVKEWICTAIVPQRVDSQNELDCYYRSRIIDRMLRAQTVMQRALSTLHHTRPCAAFVHISRSVCTGHTSRHGATCRANLPEGAHSTTDTVQHRKMRTPRQIGLLSASPVLPKLFHLIFILLARVVDGATSAKSRQYLSAPK